LHKGEDMSIIIKKALLQEFASPALVLLGGK